MTGALGPGAYLAGLVGFGVTVGCAATAATLLTRRLLPAASNRADPARLTALGLLTVAGILLAELVPLTLGILTRLAVPLAALLLLGGALVAGGRAPGSSPVPPRAPAVAALRAISPSTLMAAIALLATATAWLAWLSIQAAAPPTSTDALSFHLPGVIRFIQSGSLWQTTQYIAQQAQGNYPQNGDLLLLAVTLPWHSLAFVRYADVPLLALAALAVFATGRELRAPAPASALAALAVVAIRPTLAPALTDVLTDPTFLAGWATGILFLVRHGRTGARADLALAGLGLGIALGTKWYGLTDVPAVLVVWILARRPRPREVGLVVGMIALAGGIWLVRNLVLTGNPVFDYRVSLFGATIFAAPPNPLRNEIGFSLAHYAGDPSIIRHYIWPVFRDDFGVIGALLVAGALAAVLRARRDRRVVLLAAGALVTAIAYAITPYSAQGLAGAPVLVAANTRYGAPALILAAPLLALAIGALGRLRLLLEAVLLVAILDGLHRLIPAPTGRTVAVGAVVLAAGALLWVGRHHSSRPTRPGYPVAGVGLGVAAVLTVGFAAAAYHYQRALARAPYPQPDPTVGWVLAHAPAGTRIGITGLWTAQGLVPVAPLFGPRLTNTVQYVGRFEQHRLTEFTRRDRFLAALDRGRFPLLEVGTGFPPSLAPAAARWALSDGYRPITRSARLILLGRGG